jgi:hypothetical protein
MTSLHSFGATVPKSRITPDEISKSDMADRSEASARYRVQEEMHYMDVFPKILYIAFFPPVE